MRKCALVVAVCLPAALLVPLVFGQRAVAERVGWELLADRRSGPDREVELAVGPDRRRIILRGRFAEIYEVWTTPQSFLIAGELRRGGRLLFVVDRHRGRLLRTQSCDRYAVSPAGDRVALTAWYPRLAPRSQGGDRIGVLDLVGPSGAVPSPAHEDRSGAAVHWIYPPAGDGTTEPDAPSAERLVVSPLLWTPEGDSIVFLEHRGGDNYLVRVQVPFETAPLPAVAEKRLQPADLVISPRMRGQPGGPPPDYRLVATALDWTADGRLRVVFYPQTWLPTTAELKVP